MSFQGKYIRTLSLFVVIFLGLNPIAVFCLAYCNYHIQLTSAAHCPLKKKSTDCHQAKKATTPQNATSFDTRSTKNCVIPINVIAAPVESKYGVAVNLVIAPSVEKIDLAPTFIVRSRQTSEYHYRPPPNDLRFERVRNQVFRI
ncbi:MAG: hypothetical protein IPL32_09725 [Chloracidobacterium sp.]|nr:hypothetical protein [Chloracidobacterium sp.]